MADRLIVHCSTLRVSFELRSIRQLSYVDAFQGIDWEAKSSVTVNGYMEQLVKEITTLHKVLTKYLSPSTVHSIMGQVLDASNDKLGEEYKKVEFKTEDAKKRYYSLVQGEGEMSNLLSFTE